MSKKLARIMLIIMFCTFIALPSFTTAATNITEITLQTIDRFYIPNEYSSLERSVKRVEEEHDIKFNYNFMMAGHRPHEFDVVDQMMKRIKDSEANNELYGSTQLGEFMARDMLYPLDTIVDSNYYENLPPTFRPIKKAAVCKLNNQLYALPSLSMDRVFNDISTYRRYFPFNLGIVVFWNRDLFAREDLPDLYQLMNDNQWSWEKMGEIAELATRDLNNDGTIDQWGLTGLMLSDFAARSFPDLLMSFGAELIDYKPDGIRPNVTGPEVLKLINYLYTWNNEKEIILNDLSPRTKFADGEVAMMMGSLSSIPRINSYNSNLDFGFIYLPCEPPNENHAIPVSHTYMAALPVTVGNPEFIVEIYNDIYQPEFERINDEIKAFPDEMGLSGEDKERYLEMSENWEPVDQLSPAMMEQTELDEVINGIINGEYDRDKVDVLNELLPELYEWISDMLE